MAHGLNPLLLAAARLFFDRPESHGFVVAGGAALIAQELITRPTYDIDLFLVEDSELVGRAADAFETHARELDWRVERIVDQREFVRLYVAADNDEVIIDLGRDAAPAEPPDVTLLGPTLTKHDLAARKTLALFGRAEARDFADVYRLARRYGKRKLLSWAASQDAGFDLGVFAQMLGSADRFDDEEIPVPAEEIDRLREFFSAWRSELAASGRSDS